MLTLHQLTINTTTAAVNHTPTQPSPPLMPNEEGSYQVSIGTDALRGLKEFLQAKPPQLFFLFYDQDQKWYATQVKGLLEHLQWEVHLEAVQAGESLKTLKQLAAMHQKLFQAGVHRLAIIGAMGGGSVGDAVGFLAATYMRGVPWIPFPTTLLAQVDSAVGGKTGINLPYGKNLLGAFHQPVHVVCQTDCLRTLSLRDWVSGWAETLKMAFLFDELFLNELTAVPVPFAEEWHHAALPSWISRALVLKGKVLQADVLERTGQREWLNFGHTLGHALEQLTGYRTFRHGEALMWGMRFALRLSAAAKLLPVATFRFYDGELARFKVPPLPRDLDPGLVLAAMKQDKKVVKNLRFVLLKAVGEPVTVESLKPEWVQAELTQFLQEVARPKRRLRRSTD